MQVKSTSRFLDLRALASLQHLRFSTKRRIDGTYSGRHLSRQLGGAADFVDFREYAPGDELRHVSYFLSAATRQAFWNGTCDLVPNHFSEVPALLKHSTKCSLVIARVSPPDRHGRFSLRTRCSDAGRDDRGIATA